MNNSWRDQLSNITQSRIRFDFPLKTITTLRIGGPVDCLVDLENEEELIELFELTLRHDLPFHVFGKGSNILVPDEGLRGVGIRLGRAFQKINRKGEKVWVGAGCANATLLEKCRGWSLGGLEFLTAIPGTIGGAIAMNAGAHQGETAKFLSQVRYYQMGEGISEVKASEFSFSYRNSSLNATLGKFVLAGEFQLAHLSQEEIEIRINKFQIYRRDTQPRDYPNCGSVFKNPPGDFAAKLIEGAGLKGHIHGNAQVSEKHANFIVNRGGASAKEVMELIDLIREKVYSLNRVTLDLELKIL